MGLYGGFFKNPAVTFVQFRATLATLSMLFINTRASPYVRICPWESLGIKSYVLFI
jgi:hypothetical protein